MKELHDCRFMQAVVSGDSQRMDYAELDAAFVAFQAKLRDFVAGTAGYLEIDFQLQDLKSQLSRVLRKKKMSRTMR